MKLFVIEWLLDYANTSDYDMTFATESLGLLAIGLILAAIFVPIFSVWIVISKVKTRIKLTREYEKWCEKHGKR